MGTFAMKAMEFLAVWSLLSLMAGFVIGALICKAERVRRDEFLSDLFSTLEILQSSR
jgi:hypothetical protein